MTIKRKTKAQREAEKKAALLQRINDVYSGAQGGKWDEDDFATAEILSQVIPTLQKIFDPDGQLHIGLWRDYSLRHFDNPCSATEHLFDAGIRA